MPVKPRRPSDPRTGGVPYYLPANCARCKAALVCTGAERGWHDEFECPVCEDGLRLDVPEGFRRELAILRSRRRLRLIDRAGQPQHPQDSDLEAFTEEDSDDG